jgi:endonuclease-3
MAPALSLRKRAALVARVLKKFFPAPPIPLHHSDAFTLFVAVVLSARCTDKLVNTVTPALFKRVPDARALSKISYAELCRLIKKCGLYPTKARNLIAAARIMVELHDGGVPRTRGELEALPGVGQKTAGVVLSQAFGEPAIPVDTHIFRSARRWGLSKAVTPEKVEADLRGLFPRKEWTNLHLRMLHYARGYCTARGCSGPRGIGKGNVCPLCRRLEKI